MDDGKTEGFWRAYLGTLPEDSPAWRETYEAWPSRDAPEMADELGAVGAGCGGRSVILNAGNEPLCVVETMEVEVRRFDEVNERCAR